MFLVPSFSFSRLLFRWRFFLASYFSKVSGQEEPADSDTPLLIHQASSVKTHFNPPRHQYGLSFWIIPPHPPPQASPNQPRDMPASLESMIYLLPLHWPSEALECDMHFTFRVRRTNHQRRSSHPHLSPRLTTPLAAQEPYFPGL